MTAASPRRLLQERKRALKESSAALRREVREKVAQLPAVRKARARRRRRRLLAAAALLLLLLLIRCEGQEVEALPEGAGAPQVSVKVEPVAPAAKEGRLGGKVSSSPRGQYQGQTRPAPSWLLDFQLQVSARAPRLSQCFTGSERPGGLRWAAGLNARSGAVSDHELEPLGAGASLTAAQRGCVVRVLSTPPYRLKLPEAQELPRRVGMVIEF